MKASARNDIVTVPRSLVTEIVIIIAVAAAVGLAWNRQMLVESWTGKVQRTPTAPAPAAERLPLPLGIMQVKELFDRGEGFLLDARDGITFAKGHIMGARTLPLGEFEARLPEFLKQVPKTMPLVIYCNGYGCHDSMDLGKKLIRAGYWEVFIFEGGYPEWKEAGYPVEGTQP
jgi:rhodanese-related sulfurtransferase